MKYTVIIAYGEDPHLGYVALDIPEIKTDQDKDQVLITALKVYLGEEGYENVKDEFVLSFYVVEGHLKLV